MDRVREALEAIRSITNVMNYSGRDRKINILAEEALAAFDDGWVKCSERLPEENEHVLIWYEEGLSPMAIGYFVGNNTWHEVSGERVRENDFPASYWRPLPPPPKD